MYNTILYEKSPNLFHSFSKELLELDKNTVQYMIDEMQDEINAQKVTIQEKDQTIQQKDQEIARLRALIKEGK